MTARKPAQPKPQPEKPKNGRCRDCAKAYLMRSSIHNPVVAICEPTGERWVASMNPQRGIFSQIKGEEIIHPMIFL